jgi:thioredoxin reductase (NADPH)
MPDFIDTAVVGAGPCGLATAIALQRLGMQVVVFDRSCLVSTIAAYPTYITFFSTAEKIAIGGLPFPLAGEKPSRRDALAYYRSAVSHFDVDVRQYEEVVAIEPGRDAFTLHTRRRDGSSGLTTARAVVIATGYFGSPNLLGVPGEELPHVTHEYRDGHESFRLPAVVVGGGNSAVEAALDLYRSGARVTLVHFGPTFDKNIKPWILPDITNRFKDGSIVARWNARVTRIDPDAVVLLGESGEERLPAAHVYLMTGHTPNPALLNGLGIPIDPVTGVPAHDPETLETPVPGVFIAGVLVCGFDANRVFIENGREHGQKIATALRRRRSR